MTTCDRIGRAARASWNALTLEQARAAFIASAPIGGKWTRRKVEDKWKQQWHRNAPLAWPFGETDPHEAQPPGSDGLPFGPADDGSPSTGDDGWDNLGTADDAAPSYRTRDYGVRRKARPELHVGSAALATEFLAVEIGRGPLSGMFLRDGSIVHVPREGEDGYLAAEGRDSDGPAQIRTITGQALSARVQLTFECFTLKEAPAAEEGGTPGQTKQATMFPTAAANVVVNAPDMLPNLRPLRAVTHTPLVRADGSILTEPGYDQATGLYHLPDDGLTEVNVPDEPTSDDVAAAVVLLDRVTADFRWAGEHDRANYYGLLLTPLLRQLAPPPYKLGAIGAPQPGSGKSLLASVLRIVHGGVFRSEMPDKEDEIRKQVSTILSITTAPVVTFDNVTGILRSSTLAGLLTSPRWDDRKLGTNEMLLCANDRLWTLTGNNVTVGGDLARRTLWVTIDPGVPDPHLRTGFGIGDLESWARAHRAELIGALLTLVRAWHVAGRPTQPRRGDSFARWVETVGGILAFAGVPGVFDDASSARQVESTDDNEWGTFLHAIRAVFGDRPWTVKELLAKVRPTTIEDITRPIPLDVLPVDLAERVHKSGGNVDLVARSLGRWLTNRDGRWAGRLCVRASARDGHLGARSYTVQAPAALRL